MEEKIMDTAEKVEEIKDTTDEKTHFMYTCPKCGNSDFEIMNADQSLRCCVCNDDVTYSKKWLEERGFIRAIPRKERPLYRYLIVEYCFKDDSTNGEKHILGSYPTIGMARLNAGIYIKDNAKRMKKRYRFWQVKVQREKVFFDINMRVR